MSTPDLEAIRARNVERKRITAMTDEEEDRLRAGGWRDDDFNRAYLNLHNHDGEYICSADIDTLIAEVERLNIMSGKIACPHRSVEPRYCYELGPINGKDVPTCVLCGATRDDNGKWWGGRITGWTTRT